MKLLSFLVYFVLFLHLNEATVHSPVLHQRYGPLFDGLKLLINDEQLNAALLWNETEYHLNETSELLQTSLDNLNEYNELFQSYMQNIQNAHQLNDNVKACIKQYEREVAHFNRELIANYRVCKHSLETSLNYLHNRTAIEIDFIRTSTIQIAKIAKQCKISQLKRLNADTNQIGIVMCVLTQIGRIAQHLADSTSYCMDIIADVALLNYPVDVDVNVDIDEYNVDGDDDSCLNIIDLKAQFYEIYENVMKCAL